MASFLFLLGRSPFLHAIRYLVADQLFARNAGLSEKRLCILAKMVFLFVDDLHNPSSYDHPGTGKTRTHRAVKYTPLKLYAVVGSLDYGILFSMRTNTLLQIYTGRYVTGTSGTSPVTTVLNTGRRPVIPSRYNTVIFDYYRRDLPPNTIPARCHNASNVHKVLVPVRSMELLYTHALRMHRMICFVNTLDVPTYLSCPFFVWRSHIRRDIMK